MKKEIERIADDVSHIAGKATEIQRDFGIVADSLLDLAGTAKLILYVLAAIAGTLVAIATK